MIVTLGILSAITFTSALAITSPACGGSNAIDRIYDCDQICDKYKECADANYDNAWCADDCRAAAKDDQAYQSKADDCETCIDDRSCVDSAFQCSAQCAGIVP